jgi:cytoskeletal protein RodZ
MWAILLIIAIFACVGASAIANSGNTTTTTTNTSDNGAQVTATNSAQLAATNTSAPTATDTPAPTQSSAQTESAYKKSTTSTTVDNLDKNGNADKGKDVHFKCKILKFVKDDSGNTAGANVESSDTFSASVIQIGFPSGTDITRLNEGDTVEVWGTDAGVFSGQNAFGGTVQEVEIVALYMTDKTTNYQTH